MATVCAPYYCSMSIDKKESKSVLEAPIIFSLTFLCRLSKRTKKVASGYVSNPEPVYGVHKKINITVALVVMVLMVVMVVVVEVTRSPSLRPG